MPRTAPNDALPGLRASPLATLQALAARWPDRPALHARRHGQWQTHSWRDLDLAVRLAQAGWAALGVGAGDRVHSLGPLSLAWLASQAALQALGADLVATPADTADDDLPQARWWLVDEGHDLERLLRQRRLGPAVVVVHDDAAVDGVAPPPAGRLLSVGALLAVTPVPPTEATAVAVPLPGDRALAEFSPEWAPGRQWLQQQWWLGAHALVLPEASGDANADRCDAQPALWITPAARLRELDALIGERTPRHGLGHQVLRALRSGRWHPLGRLALLRVLTQFGLRRVRQVVSDADPGSAERQLLRALRLDSPAAAQLTAGLSLAQVST